MTFSSRINISINKTAAAARPSAKVIFEARKARIHLNIFNKVVNLVRTTRSQVKLAATMAPCMMTIKLKLVLCSATSAVSQLHFGSAQQVHESLLCLCQHESQSQKLHNMDLFLCFCVEVGSSSCRLCCTPARRRHSASASRESK